MNMDSLNIIHNTATKGEGHLENHNMGKLESENTNQQNVANSSKIARKGKGGWASAFLLLANEGLATVAFFGVGVNSFLFLRRVVDEDKVSAANNLSNWTATVSLFSLIGAFLSNSYWGRYLTCIIFQIIFVLGMTLLSLSSWLFLIKPEWCGDRVKLCKPTSPFESAIVIIAIHLVAFGYGGHQSALLTFGADQFDKDDDDNDSNPKKKKSKAPLFAYFYFVFSVGSLFSNTILVKYIEDNGRWIIGFWASTASAVIALVVFLIGSSSYRYVKPCGNPLPRVAQVFVAAVRKRNRKLPQGDNLYEVGGEESATKGSRKILHTNRFPCFDKAAIVITHEERCEPLNPWKLCTVTQIEETKWIIRILPMWLFTIIYSAVFTQMSSLFVDQGIVMNSYIGNFRLPATSMSAFDICSVLICTGLLYGKILMPLVTRLTRHSKWLPELQVMCLGLVIGSFAIGAFLLTELERHRRAIRDPYEDSLSILWQIPQYVLLGASKVFMYLGQFEFFNGQAPDGIKSLGSFLCLASIAIGNYVGNMLVIMVIQFTQGDNLYFFFATLFIVDNLFYMVCDKWYECTNVEDDTSQSGVEEKEAQNGDDNSEEQVLGRV